jgi:hypothetical protein
MTGTTKNYPRPHTFSLPGLLLRAGPLLFQDREKSEVSLRKLKANCFPLAICLLLAFMSEIQVEAEFGLADRLKYVWRFLAEYYDSDKRDLRNAVRRAIVSRRRSEELVWFLKT